MFIRKTAAVLLSSIMLLTAACSGGGTTGSPSTGAPSTGSPPAGGSAVEERDITITYWIDPRFRLVQGLEEQTRDFGDWEKLQAAAFMELHPNVKVEVQALTSDDLAKKVPVSITSKTNPDILRDYLGRTSQYAHQGVLENLENLLPREELDDYIPGYLEQYTINGHLHALPSYAWAFGMVVNRALWTAQGKADLLPTPDKPYWTVEQFDQALRTVSGSGRVPLAAHVAGAQGDTGLLAHFWSFGAKFFKDGDYSKVALNSPEGVKALEYLVRLHDDGLLQPGVVAMQLGDVNTLFDTGTVGAYGGTLALWNRIENAQKDGTTKAEFDLSMVHFPNDDGVSNGIAIGPTGLAIFKQEDDYKRKMVLEFAMFLNSTDYQKQYAINAGQFPVKKSAGVPMADDPNYQALQQIINERGLEDMGLTIPKYAEIRVLLQPEVQAALLKRKTPAEALRDYETAANQVLQGQ